jgi:putative flippase GtrA
MLRLPVRTISKVRARVAAVVAPIVFKSTLIGQFFRFGTVGTSGFLIDTAIVYGLKGKLGIYAAGMMSYLVVASWCWALNRCWTFGGHGSGPSHHQWARYLLMNLLGLVINRGTYAALVTGITLCAIQPVFATAGGAVAGMTLNFALARQMVFR